MYRDAVDQATQHDIAAAAAAHHELGRDYDGAVAESLVDRIGAEIDKRVDTKLAARDQGRRRPAEVTQADRRRALWLGIGIGSAATGVTALIVSAVVTGQLDGANLPPGPSHNVSADMLAALLGVWGLLVVIYVVYAWKRHARGRE
jgi:anti-sigma-K factor RskA